MAIATEKQLTTALLRKYRDLPCLWDRTHEDYNVKIKRNEAYTRLLTWYRTYEPKTTIADIKKKIGHTRAVYRRIHGKVLKARANGKVYEPLLWYYKELKFLDEGVGNKSDDEQLEEEKKEEEIETNEENVQLKLDQSPSYSPPPVKKRFSFTEDAGPSCRADFPFIEVKPLTITNNSQNTSSSTENFGRTVASQLDELSPLQRYIAEKLISEVMFYGRLEKLCIESSINLNDYS